MSDREEIAVNNVRAFSVFAAGKLPPHVVEDLRIVCTLAAIAIADRNGNRRDRETGLGPQDESGGAGTAIAQPQGLS